VVVVEGLEDLVNGEFRVAAARLKGLRDPVEKEQPGRALSRDGGDPAVPYVGTELNGQVTVEVHHGDYAPAKYWNAVVTRSLLVTGTALPVAFREWEAMTTT
jgi:hypothetical protein